jgi:hypothetical protein
VFAIRAALPPQAWRTAAETQAALPRWLNVMAISPIAGALDDIGLLARQSAFRAALRVAQRCPEATQPRQDARKLPLRSVSLHDRGCLGDDEHAGKRECKGCKASKEPIPTGWAAAVKDACACWTRRIATSGGVLQDLTETMHPVAGLIAGSDAGLAKLVKLIKMCQTQLRIAKRPRRDPGSGVSEPARRAPCSKLPEPPVEYIPLRAGD